MAPLKKLISIMALMVGLSLMFNKAATAAEPSFNEVADCGAFFAVTGFLAEKMGDNESKEFAVNGMNYFLSKMGQMKPGASFESLRDDMTERASNMLVSISEDPNRIDALVNKYGNSCVEML